MEQIMKINSKIFTIWGKYLAYSAITAIATIGKSPLDFSSHDWKMTANGIWIAIVPVVLKWANPKDELTLTKPKA